MIIWLWFFYGSKIQFSDNDDIIMIGEVRTLPSPPIHVLVGGLFTRVGNLENITNIYSLLCKQIVSVSW